MHSSKIMKMSFKIIVKILKFAFIIAWDVFLDEERDRRIKNYTEFQNDYDEYEKIITNRKSF